MPEDMQYISIIIIDRPTRYKKREKSMRTK